MKPATNILTGCWKISIGGAHCCNLPLDMTAIRSPIVIASTWSCVT